MMADISVWISLSLFLMAVAALVHPVGILLDDVEDPTLEHLVRAHRSDPQDELLEGLLEHPVVDLLQDVREVGLELVGGDEHAEPMLVLALEGFRRVNAALVLGMELTA